MADAPTSSTSVGNTIADAPANTRRMVKTLSLVSALSGLLIVGAFQVTAPYIEANREARIDRAIFQVVPGGTTKREFGFGGFFVVVGAVGVEGVDDLFDVPD